MTQSTVCQPLSRAPMMGLMLGALAAVAGYPAAAQVRSLVPPPAAEAPLAVSAIDFNRAEAGTGRFTLTFNRPAAAVDLRRQGSDLVLDIPGATLAPTLARQLNVSDFATPVASIRAENRTGSARITLGTATATLPPLAYQAGNTYVLELAPAPLAMPVASQATPPAASPATPASARAFSGKPVTFNFQDVPVRTVLQLIAEEAKLNLVVADSVAGNATLRLVNVPWDQALDIVLRAKGLDQRRNGNVVWVAPQAEMAAYEQGLLKARMDQENGVELQTLLLPVSYASATDLAKLLSATPAAAGSTTALPSGGFLSPRGSLSADERTNTLMVIDTPSRVEKIRAMVDDLDRPVDQVLIEARIVLASESFAKDLGVRFGVSGATGTQGDQSSLGFGGNLDDSRANALGRANAVAAGDPNGRSVISTGGLNVNLGSGFSNAGSLAFSILNAGHMLDVELSALQQEGRGEVISNPRIVTSNQKEAIIRQGQQVGYVTISPTQGSVPIPNVQFKDVLLEMIVTPTITHDGRVFLDMKVKKDDVEGFVDTSIGQVPTVSTREVTTAVLIEDGQTVVVGGVYEFRNRQDLSKVPFLADLPIIGNLFKTRGRSHEKAELLIFMTPKVMRVAPRPAAAIQH